ncbi:unnamed protein product [Parascedosporium putredinis]|uniref:CFEM domain-containing protein n=1 Tax=Parascedosporium putredinis TaxID=1442378 RepID=A0A9P1H0C4_9PEZI|nr:unnamed protein product [Parascedosporium putredinis]CAI7992536.1 unnamed protein product [Parascedosporium putredinis]
MAFALESELAPRPDRPDDPPDLCPLVDGSCPDNEDASHNGGTKCGMKQYERECYCNLKTGLVCAWSCPWDLWWETEDWFAKLCPESPALKVDYSGLPDCARDCIDDTTFSYGCITQSVNCFCADGDLHDCHNSCSSDEEWAQIEEWLQNTCDMDADEAKFSGSKIV